MAISNGFVVVGAPHHANFAGRAYVFEKTASGWTQSAELTGSNTLAGDGFGGSVALWGATTIVGAYEHGRSAGRAYVFES